MKRKKWWTEETRAYLILVAPAVLIYWAVMAFPTVFSLVLSMTDYSGTQIVGVTNPFRFVGLANYSRMFTDPFFWISLKNNFLIVFISVFGQIPLGFILAYILYRRLVRAPRLFQTMIYLPTVISVVVVGILWQSFFNAYGPFTKLMQYIIPGWQNTISIDPKLAMLPVLFVMLWMYTGNYLIIFLANLQGIPPELIEAAKIDGASEGKVLRYVILPGLSGVIVTCVILAVSGSLNSFGLIWAMTQGNPALRTSVLSVYMYIRAFQGAGDYPLANAISTFTVALSFVMILLTRVVERRFGGRHNG